MKITILIGEYRWHIELNWPGRCACCGRISFYRKLTLVALTSDHWCLLCPPCDVQNDRDTKGPWDDYFGSKL